jgi:signal recognition particle subunit SEC65
MSLKKELLDKLTEKQLKKLAESKGIKIHLSEAQEKYYSDWNDKQRLVDIMTDKEDITIKEIEDYIRNFNSKN